MENFLKEFISDKGKRVSPRQEIMFVSKELANDKSRMKRLGLLLKGDEGVYLP